MIIKTCAYCKKEYQFDETKPVKAKFTETCCSYKCKHRINMKEKSNAYYYKMKDNSDYKTKKANYFKSWIDKNRAHFNDLCRDKSRILAAKKRVEWVANDLCTHCGRERDVENRKSCRKCLELFKISSIRKKEKMTQLSQSKQEQSTKLKGGND